MVGTTMAVAKLLPLVAPALLGNMLEFYEYNAYTSLTSEISANLYPSHSSQYPVWTAFAVGQALRPVGALLFGLLSDRVGRRPVIIISTIGMALCTAGIGCIPTPLCCHTPSPLSIGLLLFLRVAQGLFAAGELVSVLAFCAEHASPSRLAFSLALPFAAAQLGGLLANSLSALIEAILSPYDLQLWGWRLPFLLTLPVGVAIAAAQRLMPEPPASSPALPALQITGSIFSSQRVPLLTAILLCSLQPAFQYGGLNYFKDFIISRTLQSSALAGWAFALATLLSIPSVLASGLLSDRFGHPRLALAFATAALSLLFPTWCLLVAPLSGTAHVFLAASILGLLFGLIVPFSALAIRLFPPGYTATLMGVGYNIAQAAFGTPAPFVSNALVDGATQHGSSWLAYTLPALYPTLIALLSFCGLLQHHLTSHAYTHDVTRANIKARTGESGVGRKSPHDWPVAITATISLLLDLTSTTVIVPFLPTYDLSSGATSAVFLLKPAVEMGSNLLALGPSAVDLLGPRRPAIVGTTLILLGTLLLCSSTLPLLLLARALGGLGASLVVPAMFKMVNYSYALDPTRRDRVVSVALAGDALGGVVGPILGAAGFNLAHGQGASMTLSRLVPLCLVAALCVVCFSLLLNCPNDSAEKEPVLSLGSVYSRRGISSIGIAALAFGCTSFHIGVLEATTPLLLIGYGLADSGYVWALVGLGFCISAPLAVSFMGCLHAPPWCCVYCGTEGPAHPGRDAHRPTSVCGCIGISPKAWEETSALRVMASQALRHAWAAVSVGGVLLLLYSVSLLWMLSQLRPKDTTLNSSPAAGFLVEFCFAMLLLGLGLGMIYPPLNTFTQDITVQLLDRTALARTLGFLQGAKNTGLILGYIIGPAIVDVSSRSPCGYLSCDDSEVNRGSEDTPAHFKTVSIVLSCVAGFTIFIAISLRAQGTNALRAEAGRLLPTVA